MGHKESNQTKQIKFACMDIVHAYMYVTYMNTDIIVKGVDFFVETLFFLVWSCCLISKKVLKLEIVRPTPV